MNILVLSAGGPAAIGLIKSFKLLDIPTNIISCDIDPLAAGFCISDKSYIINPIKPETIKSNWEEILNIIKKEKIDLILPTSDRNSLLISKYKNLLTKLGVKTFISSFDTINVCLDKLKFWEHLNKSFNMPSPIKAVFEKPNTGSGSKNSHLITPQMGCSLWEYLPGNEYTVDVFCDNANNIICTSVRERVGVKAGISVKGKVIYHPYIEKESKRLCKELNIKGPCCIQWKEDTYGTPKLIECNPRLGGGTYMTTLAGGNPAEIYLKLSQNNPINPVTITPITVTRSYNEHIV